MIPLGFLGAGNHARHHMKEFARLPQGRLTAVFDVDAARAEAAARDFPSLRAMASLDALLDHSGIEAVVIATPAETHAELVAAALAAGKHVLLEKPLAHTPEAALAIVTLAEAHPDRVVLIGHCERFNRAYMDVKKAVTEGKIGIPGFASASRLSPLHLNDPGWKLGTLDTAVHDIDLILWLIGSRPTAVAASGTTVNPSLAIADHVAYQIHFENGALAQGHIGWVPFSGGYPMQGNAHPRLFLAGSGGTISLDLWQRPVAVHSHGDGAYFWPDDVLTGYSDYFTEVSAQNFAFLQAISGGVQLPITPQEAYTALHVAYAAHESLTQRGGAPVHLKEDLGL
jgi:predicted dehydrogenase